jgi:hypothetical protein
VRRAERARPPLRLVAAQEQHGPAPDPDASARMRHPPAPARVIVVDNVSTDRTPAAEHPRQTADRCRTRWRRFSAFSNRRPSSRPPGIGGPRIRRPRPGRPGRAPEPQHATVCLTVPPGNLSTRLQADRARPPCGTARRRCAALARMGDRRRLAWMKRRSHAGRTRPRAILRRRRSDREAGRRTPSRRGDSPTRWRSTGSSRGCAGRRRSEVAGRISGVGRAARLRRRNRRATGIASKDACGIRGRRRSASSARRWIHGAASGTNAGRRPASGTSALGSTGACGKRGTARPAGGGTRTNRATGTRTRWPSIPATGAGRGTTSSPASSQALPRGRRTADTTSGNIGRCGTV